MGETMNEQALTAGRELDVLVAEKVMGVEVVCLDWPCGREPECGCYDAALNRDDPASWETDQGPVCVTPGFENAWPPRLVGDEMYAAVEPIPFYSTDIEAAWPVIERLKELGARPSLEVSIRDDEAWYCEVHPGLVVEDANACLAICKAALLWADWKANVEPTLPTLADPRGIDPDFTGGLSSEEYVRQMRDDGE
jgi:hypothetical protein